MSAEPIPRFQQLQQQMTDWLRKPDSKPAPDVELRRLTIYRELFFNNVRDFVENAYPLLKSLLLASEWSALIDEFFAEHRCKSPYFRDISLEFRAWMESDQPELLQAHPWIQEVLHFEWMELAVECAEAGESDDPVAPDGNLLDGIPVVAVCVWPLAYRWPVHRLTDEGRPQDEPPGTPTCLIAFRDDKDRAHFVEVSPMTVRLIELLKDGNDLPGRAVLEQLASEVGHSDVAGFVSAGQAMLTDLRTQGILRGIRA